MKLTYAQLTKRLGPGGAELPPVLVIGGDQDLLRELAVKGIVHSIVGEDESPFAMDKFDGESCDGTTIVGAANLMPMLGGRRVVVVKRAQKLLEKSEELQGYVADPAPTTVLVLELSKSPDRRRKTWKAIEKAATVVSCDAPRPAELSDWVVEQAKIRDLSLGRDGVRYLVSEFGGDLRRLTNELEKLSLYSAGERIDPETIATVLGRGKAQSIFKFIDAVGSGDSAKALRQLGRLLEEGEPPLRVLALLDRLVGQLRIAREATVGAGGSRGRGGGGMAKLLGVPPSTADALAEAARRMDESKLAAAVGGVSACDRLLKSSSVAPRIALESLTMTLCAGGPAPPVGRAASSRRSR